MRMIAASLIALTALTGVASAQSYPNHPIKMIVPWPAGGVADVAARAVAEEMRGPLGQPIVIDNRPGASGKIGTELVVHAAPDGYTLLYTNPSNQTAPAVVNPKIGFDPVTDFTPVIQTVQATYFLVVNANSPIKSVADLVAAAKAHPGKLNYGNAGIGSVSHFAVAKFLTSAKIDVVSVAYKGEAAAVADLLAGSVQMMFMTGAKPYVDEGRLRALGTCSPEPWFTLPNVPTIAGAGLPGFQFLGWQGIVAPAKTPADIVQKLNAAANTALKSPRTRKILEEQGVKPIGGSPDVIAQTIKSDVPTFRQVIADAHLTFEQ